MQPEHAGVIAAEVTAREPVAPHARSAPLLGGDPVFLYPQEEVGNRQIPRGREVDRRRSARIRNGYCPQVHVIAHGN
jgi:hypothetical protein